MSCGMKVRVCERGCYAGERRTSKTGEEDGVCRTFTGDLGGSFVRNEDGGRLESDAAQEGRP
jgi:hypothetical protein